MESPRPFTVPIYQRMYSWIEKECKQLWDDILRAGKEKELYFIGSIVYIEERLSKRSDESPHNVIDGQQRLTAISLLIEALARQLEEDRKSASLFQREYDLSAKKLRNRYLLNADEAKEEKRYKLLLTTEDKETFLNYVKPKDERKDPSFFKESSNIKASFDFFQKNIQESSDEDLCFLWDGLKKLVIVDMTLEKDKDKPQLIFEGMNARGKELSQTDLIRNFILMDQEPSNQKEIYENYWRPMERIFDGPDGIRRFDDFTRCYLTMKAQGHIKMREVYEEFKKHVQKRATDLAGEQDAERAKPLTEAHERAASAQTSGAEAEAHAKSAKDLAQDLYRFATYYNAVSGQETKGAATDEKLKAAFADLNKLDAKASYPFLLRVYDDWKQSKFSTKEFEGLIRNIESFIFRRWVCDVTQQGLNNFFASFSRNIKEESYIESVQAYWLKQERSARFPKDEEFQKHIQERNLYYRNRQYTSYLLEKLENHSRKEPVNAKNFTVEHILPQNKNLSLEWQTALGENWKRVQGQWLHTLGNLTLTGYNSEYSDKPFIEKRDMEGGFAESRLQLNKSLKDFPIWNEESIKERAAELSEKALKIWPFFPAKNPPSFRPELAGESEGKEVPAEKRAS